MNQELKEIIQGVRRSLRLIDSPERKTLFLASVIMLITGLLTNLPAVILGRLVDNLSSQPQLQFESIFPYITLIIVIILIREALTVWRKYQVENIATQTEKKQTVATVMHVLHVDSNSLDDMRLGTLHGRIFRSVEGLVRIIKLGFLDFLPTIFVAFTALIIALFQKPLIASVMILVVPSGLFIIMKQIGSQKGIRVNLLRGKEQIDGNIVEILGGLETVRSLDTIDYETTRIERSAENLRAKEITHHLQMALYDAAKYLNEGFFYVLVICLSIYFASRGVISRGDILVYSILFLSVLHPLREIHRILDEAHESSIRVNDLYELNKRPIDEAYGKSLATTPKSVAKNAIEMKNVSYAYASRSHHSVLSAINLTIKKGEKIGIAGVSGGGKSTFVKLLLRLQHNYSGTIILLGHDLKTIDRHNLAEHVAYVPQKTYVFSGTIRDNIVYGSRQAHISDAAIINAAKKAQLWHEIETSLGGLNGIVTEQGNNLSGGQKQRLAIARLVFHAPDIIIFDEATSALDNQNEAKLQRVIETIFSEKTVITIAHRLTTLENCDRILVFSEGTIAEQGSFQELSDRGGLFYSFLHKT